MARRRRWHRRRPAWPARRAGSAARCRRAPRRRRRSSPPWRPRAAAPRCRRRRSRPARTRRRRCAGAIGPPMLPRPTKPSDGRGHVAGSGVMPSASSTWRARRNASTPAGTPAYTAIWMSVSRSSSSVQPLPERRPEVGLELLGPVERRQQAEVVEAALPVGERRAAPDPAPAVLGDDLLELVVEAVGRRHGARHVLLAEHTRARLQPDVEQLGIHGSSPRPRRLAAPYHTGA